MFYLRALRKNIVVFQHHIKNMLYNRNSTLLSLPRLARALSTTTSTGNRIVHGHRIREQCVLLGQLLHGSAGADYMSAFIGSEGEEAFLTYYDTSSSPDHTVQTTSFTRAAFLDLSLRALLRLHGLGVRRGDRVVHYMTRNCVEDLVYRHAAALLGSVPVTINWQSDNAEAVQYKVLASQARVVLVDAGAAAIVNQKNQLSEVTVASVSLADLHGTALPSDAEILHVLRSPEALPRPGDARCVIFTSGTTGQPKGVQLTYDNYAANRDIFDAFLGCAEASTELVLVAVNPLHHTNSTSMADWAMRRPRTRLHLVDRYSSRLWALLVAAVYSSSHPPLPTYKRVFVLPLVSRHIDFLDSLAASHALGVDAEELRRSLAQCVLLLGSAPVGPATVERLLRLAGRLPTVRFGSTETTLQVCGVPLTLSHAQAMCAFERGWRLSPLQGYYIGRAHPPHTEVRVVESVDPQDRAKGTYLRECAEGVPGYLVTRGRHVMKAYLTNNNNSYNNTDITAAGSAATAESEGPVNEDGWYLNLGDIGFWLSAPPDNNHKQQEGEETSDSSAISCWLSGDQKGVRRDLYWCSRESSLLIKGGANYAYPQIEAELTRFVCAHYGLSSEHEQQGQGQGQAKGTGEGMFRLAVCGARLGSEHEDSLCVLLEPLDARAQAVFRSDLDCSEAEAEAVEQAFLQAARQHSLSKGAKPDYLLVGRIPVVESKGVVNVPEMRRLFAAKYKHGLLRGLYG